MKEGEGWGRKGKVGKKGKGEGRELNGKRRTERLGYKYLRWLLPSMFQRDVFR